MITLDQKGEFKSSKLKWRCTGTDPATGTCKIKVFTVPVQEYWIADLELEKVSNIEGDKFDEQGMFDGSPSGVWCAPASMFKGTILDKLLTECALYLAGHPDGIPACGCCGELETQILDGSFRCFNKMCAFYAYR